MNMSASQSNRSWTLILLSTVLLLAAGCGGTDSESELDPLGLLTDYKQAVPRHHPYDLVEIPLGEEFEVSIAIKDSYDQYRIKFNAAAIVPREKQEELTAQIETFDSRIRSAVLDSAGNMSPDNISDPYQAWLKSEILAKIARMIKSRDVRDVVFSDYSFERR